MNTEGNQKFTLLVEIKRPNTRFFDVKQYRNGVPGFNSEFANAVSQVQVNSYTWEFEGSRREKDVEILTNQNIRTASPRSVLVIGHTRDLDTPDKRKAFELFRNRLHAPEVITFDELLARAQFIVSEPVV